VRVNRHALTEIRERSGWTKSRLAAEAGTSRGHICDVEHGRRQPSAETLSRIAAALKVPLASLLATPSDEPVPPTIEERVEFLELQMEVACSTLDATLAELRAFRAEVREAIRRVNGGAD